MAKTDQPDQAGESPVIPADVPQTPVEEVTPVKATRTKNAFLSLSKGEGASSFVGFVEGKRYEITSASQQVPGDAADYLLASALLAGVRLTKTSPSEAAESDAAVSNGVILFDASGIVDEEN